MINEAVLRSVRETLKKVDELSKLESLDYLMEEYGINGQGLSKNEIIYIILTRTLSVEEMSYYNQYLEYERSKKTNQLIATIDNLDRVTKDADRLYMRRKELLREKHVIDEHVRKIKMDLRKMPIIRAKIQYSRLKKALDEYYKTKARSGLKESELSDSIQKIKSSNIIVRVMRRKKADKLTLELSKISKKNGIRIKQAYSSYEGEIKEYCSILKELFLEIMKNRDIKNAAILTVNMKYNNCYNLDGICDGTIPRIPDELINSIDLEDLYTKFVAVASFSDEEEITAELFYERLVKFVCYYFVTKSSKAEWQSHTILNEVHNSFLKQKELVASLETNAAGLDNNREFTEDQKDTFALVYVNDAK